MDNILDLTKKLCEEKNLDPIKITGIKIQTNPKTKEKFLLVKFETPAISIIHIWYYERPEGVSPDALWCPTFQRYNMSDEMTSAAAVGKMRSIGQTEAEIVSHLDSTKHKVTFMWRQYLLTTEQIKNPLGCVEKEV